jgi:hypothetical protein
MAAKTVDEYISGLEDWQAGIVSTVRGLILDTEPEAKESIKWAQPVYESNGPFCYIKAFKKHVNFGFWRGAELSDAGGVLQGTGEKMRHVSLTNVEEIQTQVLRDLVREAVELNRVLGDPTRRA